jgi:mannose-6-phosphate isomerase-like protein (cupin superfamily)
MENNKMTGTLDSHLKISKVLGISLSELYKGVEDENKPAESLPRKKRTEHLTHSSKVKCEFLVTNYLEKKILPALLTISPGGATQKEENRPGVEKFIYVLSGAIEAFVGEKNFFLKSEDSLYFDASLSHHFKNASENESSAIYVISPPSLGIKL